MKLILFIALLPCLWAAGVERIVCPDGNECAIGKTCCGLKNGGFECCDLSEEDQQNKKLIPALPPNSAKNTSSSLLPDSQAAFDYCPTTQCGLYCCPHVRGVCCSNPMYCCDTNTRCCSNSYSQTPWCCLSKHRCHTTYGYCIGGATSVSVTILSLLSAFALGMISKYLL